jgi:poly-gamma-glutamate synthesis protein (capsule biosynthesis protein)
MPDTVTLGAVGDIAPAGQIEEEIAEHGAGWPLAKMRQHLDQCDILFGNMEAIMLPPDVPKERFGNGLFVRDAGVEFATAMRDAGFDILNMAANHVLDGGSVGMDYTKNAIERAGIIAAGVGYSQAEARRMPVIEKNGISFGFLCYAEDNNYSLGHTNPGPAYFKKETVLEDIRSNRDQVDILVVSNHADLEFMPTPSWPRREVSREIARAGADIFLQHHPHVPQGVEMVDGCLIAYSLGNFIFCAKTSAYQAENGPHTAHSFLLKIQVGKSGVISHEKIPFDIYDPPEQRPTPVCGDAREKALAYLAELDRLVRDDEFVRNTWREIALRHFEIYHRRIREMPTERVLEELVGRLLLVDENLPWMREILEIAREKWERQKSEECKYARPHNKFEIM